MEKKIIQNLLHKELFYQAHSAAIEVRKFSKLKNILVAISFILVAISVLPLRAQAAEEGLSLTVTPPLFQLNIGPGESWTSSLKIVNSNPFDLTVYASLMDFEAQGEEGHGKFIPIMDTQNDADGTQNNAENFARTDAESSHSLASWIEISKEPIFVPKGQSEDVVFTVRIPENAEPGGHYAAILVGTKPMGGAVEEGAMVSVSSMITSLLFVNVKGDVLESGNIREFKSEKSFYQKPDVNFVLRFENKGNVHLQPQGDIVIYNMWGKERGKIFINHKSSFGNILPSSVRKFSFEWKGEKNIFEAGKYKAIATLSFGSDSRQNISAAAYFWVVPVVPILGIVFGFALLIFLVVWSIRLYIRRALKIEADKRGFKTSISVIPQAQSAMQTPSSVIPQAQSAMQTPSSVIPQARSAMRNPENYFLDSRLRGNDKKEEGNDKKEEGNDKKEQITVDASPLNLRILAQPIYEEILDLKKIASQFRGTDAEQTRGTARNEIAETRGTKTSKCAEKFRVVLRKILRGSAIAANYFKLAFYILQRYWKVLVFLGAVILIIIFLTAYFGQTFLPSREFEIKTHQDYRI